MLSFSGELPVTEVDQVIRGKDWARAQSRLGLLFPDALGSVLLNNVSNRDLIPEIVRNLTVEDPQIQGDLLVEWVSDYVMLATRNPQTAGEGVGA